MQRAVPYGPAAMVAAHFDAARFWREQLLINDAASPFYGLADANTTVANETTFELAGRISAKLGDVQDWQWIYRKLKPYGGSVRERKREELPGATAEVVREVPFCEPAAD